MKRIVMKFGGTSVESIEKMKRVAKRIEEKKQEGYEVVVVVSAMGKQTDELVRKAFEISKDPSDREMDVLLSTGEQQSMAFLVMALHELNLKAISLTGWQAGIKTTGSHQKNRIASIPVERLEEHLNNGEVVVVAGFQGINEYNDITTLGRGGSDTSAVALAVSLKCSVEINTDVMGIYSVDPRVFKNARKLDELTYDETLEMASLGASVIEPRSVELASYYNVPMEIRHSFENQSGTRIMRETSMLEETRLSNVSVVEDVVIVNITALQTQPAQLFTELAHVGINVDVISQNMNHDISFTINKQDITRLEKTLKDETFTLKDGLVKLSIIGNAMRTQPGVAARAYEIFSENEISFYQVSTSEISISFIIDENHKQIIMEKMIEVFNINN
ncbi:MAG: aspartate kinase [Erysipelothrix sp.]|nr:aspartate kinase [Erysipelothrix sp.]